jgi:hypothetical protein
MGRKRGGDACVHHWIVETPYGARTVAGRCKKCGAEKSYVIFIEENLTIFDSPLNPQKMTAEELRQNQVRRRELQRNRKRA